MQRNQHKRLAKVVVPRFDPTWLGEPGEPSSTAAVLPPVATTPDVEPTTALQTSVPPLTTSTPTPAAPATTSTPAAQTTEALTTSSQLTTEQSTSALQTSTTPLTTAVQSTTPQSAAVATTTPVVRISTPATTRNAVATASVRGGTTVTQTVDASATPSETALPESPGNVGTIVGAVAGSLVGLVVLVAFVSWIIRKHNKRKGDDFDRQSYLRNSMMIPDEPARPIIGTQAALALARSNNNMGPRPPSMLERKPTYMMPNGQPSPSFVPGQVISFDPGQVVAAPYAANDGPYPSPMAFAAYTPPAQHHQSELSRRPSGAQLLTRQPTNGAAYDPSQAPSPGGYGSEYQQSPGGYNDGYTYPMHPGFAAERGMVQSVTPFQAQQYAEITRALEGPDFAATHESFHPISPVPPSPVSPSPVGHAISDENVSTFAPSSTGEKPMVNPFEEPQRVAAAPPSLPPIESVSRTGTPIDPNPQHAHWSYDGKAQPGQRLSVAGMPAPVIQAPAMPPAAVTREERTVVVGNGEELKAKRPVSYVDTDDAYGGM